MKFKDVPQDEQFVLPAEVVIAAGVMFQKQYTGTAIIIEDINIPPDQEVELVADSIRDIGNEEASKS
jgi:hypothetical protein